MHKGMGIKHPDSSCSMPMTFEEPSAQEIMAEPTRCYSDGRSMVWTLSSGKIQKRQLGFLSKRGLELGIAGAGGRYVGDSKEVETAMLMGNGET